MCDSTNLDGLLLAELETKGLISGASHTPLKTGTPKYNNLRVTILGKEHIELFSNQPTKVTTTKSKSWYTHPLTIVIGSVIPGVLVVGVLKLLGWD